ncbi:MAG: PilZ domain-containing protein [Planctomycetaceae bacterium]
MASDTRRITIDYDRQALLSVLGEIRARSVKPTERQPLLCDSPQRRTGTRVPLTVPVDLVPVTRKGMRYAIAGDAKSAETIDISSGGVALAVATPVPLSDEFVAITFQLPNSESATLLAEVVWQAPGGAGCHRIGARFLGVAR